MNKTIFFLLAITGLVSTATGQPWQADLGNWNYKNPILYADYSDPDICKAGADFYMTASSFNCIPGLPILHSKDLVNWELVGYVLNKLEPACVFNQPQPGNGVWAPAIRFHNGEFYIFYPDPDYGIFLTKAKNPAGPWSEPVLVQAGKGWIDPCPLWDEDGKAYLVNAFAGSRAGFKSILVVHEMSPDGTKLIGDGVLVFDGHKNHPTVEGPKFYKRNGYYYIFAPAGGVPAGWQLILRSKNVYGPYEEKIVLHQGNTNINGPHQGGWVELDSGESWFIHFQDAEAYGRIVHLQPVKWVDDWPLMGIDSNNDGIGEPVSTFTKPNVGGKFPANTIPATDEFNGPFAGLQWQWSANPAPGWMFGSGNMGFLRLNCVLQSDSITNLWEVPNLFLQKFPAPEFTATVKLTFQPAMDGDKVGLVVMGQDYAYISVEKTKEGIGINRYTCLNAPQKMAEIQIPGEKMETAGIYLQVQVSKGAVCRFAFSADGKKFKTLGEDFIAKPGKWIGAKVGLFAVSNKKTNDSGYADIDWFRVN